MSGLVGCLASVFTLSMPCVGLHSSDARHQYLLYRCHVLDFMRRMFLVVMLVAMSGIGIHALDVSGRDAMVKNHIAPF